MLYVVQLITASHGVLLHTRNPTPVLHVAPMSSDVNSKNFSADTQQRPLSLLHASHPSVYICIYSKQWQFQNALNAAALDEYRCLIAKGFKPQGCIVWP